MQIDQHVRDYAELRREWLLSSYIMPWGDFVGMMCNEEYQVWIGV